MRRSPRPSPSPTRESLRRVLIRDAFYRQGPFLGSGGHYSPGPTTDSPLLAMRRPLNGTLAPPWVLVRTSPHSGKQAEPRRTFHSLHPSMVSPTAVRFELDPRSLDPAALFGARMPSLFEARRRLTTSATALRRASNQTRALMFSQGRRPRSPSFSLRITSLFRAVMRGEPRDVHLADPGAGSSRLREFAQPRCLQERPTTGGFTRGCIVRIDAHGSKDRAKDASRGACDDVSCLHPVPTHNARKPTAFPSSATFGHPLSPARAITAEEAAAINNEPTKVFVPTSPREERRHPENRDVFCRHDTRRK